MTSLGSKGSRFLADQQAHDLGGGAYAYLQPDEGSGWGWSNGGLVVDGAEPLLVDTLRDEKLTKSMLDALRDATGLAAGDIGRLVNNSP